MLRDTLGIVVATLVIWSSCVCTGRVHGEAAADASLRLQPNAAGTSGRRQAILIGIASYQKGTPLPYTANDVAQLAATLDERGGYDVMEIVDTARTAPTQSETEAMQAKLGSCLSNLTPEDDVLLYFTGHGFRHEDRLYLAMVDCDPSDPKRGGLPLAWLRNQLAACPAKFKLLILDTCHSGSDKGAEPAFGVSANDLALPLADVESVMTLASSQAQELSLTWSEKRQSLFTYWLNQGLKGHADKDGDEQITVEELYDYLFDKVTAAAERLFHRQQTPVRRIGLGIRGTPVVVSLKPFTLRGLLGDMAEQLSTAMQQQGWTRVGVPEFTADARDRLTLGAQFGTLGRYCAVELARGLQRRSGDRFRVVETESLETALAGKGIHVQDTPKVRDLSVQGEELPLIAVGELRNRSGRRLTVQCKLIGLRDATHVTLLSGTADLNDSELAMLGKSFTVPEWQTASIGTPEPDWVDRSPLANATGTDAKPGPHGGLSNKRDFPPPHPMEEPDFEFPVTIWVKEEQRKPEFLTIEVGGERRREMYVALDEGERYSVRVENRSTRKVLMRLLVDGRNTLPQEVPTEHSGIESVRLETAYTVNLDDAAHWLLLHAEEGKAARTYEIKGFFSELGKSAKYREFTVARAPDMPGERDVYGKNLGIITAAFYSLGTPTRGLLMTIPGTERNQALQMHDRVEVGRLMRVVQLHYVDPQAFDKVKLGLEPLRK